MNSKPHHILYVSGLNVIGQERRNCALATCSVATALHTLSIKSGKRDNLAAICSDNGRIAKVVWIHGDAIIEMEHDLEMEIYFVFLIIHGATEEQCEFDTMQEASDHVKKLLKSIGISETV